MRRRGLTHGTGRAGHFGEINVTPLIDVVMCLIIFYLMVGKLATDRKAEVKLPKSTVGSQAEPEVLIVNVLSGAGMPARADVVVEGKPIDVEADLEPLVRQRLESKPGTVVEVRASRDLPFGVVSPVLHACTKGGGQNIRLATERVGGGAR
jgi:biopolymer transport protein ExbD